MRSFINVIALVCALVPLAACQSILQRELVIEAPLEHEQAGLAGYAMTLGRMSQAELDAAVNQAKQAFAANANAGTRSRYGLALSQWGHAGYNPVLAANLLSEAVPEMVAAGWSQADLDFVRFQAAQLRFISVIQDRLRASQLEKTQFEAQLNDAEAKLKAIADIEQDLEKKRPVR